MVIGHFPLAKGMSRLIQCCVRSIYQYLMEGTCSSTLNVQLHVHIPNIHHLLDYGILEKSLWVMSPAKEWAGTVRRIDNT